MGEDGRIEFAYGLNDKEFANGANRIRQQVGDITAHVEKSGMRMDQVFDNIKNKVVTAFAIGSLAEFERKIISVRSEMQSLQISFETLAGTQMGKQLYNDIKYMAATTSMMMGDLAKGAQTLLGFNIEAEKVMPILREIGDISMGDAQKFNSLTLAFAQMSSTGKLMGQDLLQMINAGFNPLVVIAEKTGKSVAALKEEMAKGQISVEMVEDAFRSAASEGGKFNGMLAQQAQGMKGAIAQMEGAIQNALNGFGEAQEGILVDGVHLITSAIENYETLGTAILTIATAYGAWKAAQMVVIANENIINQQRASIDAERIASLEAVAGEYAAATASEEANTAAKEANISAIDAQIAAIGNELQAKAGEAAANLEAAEFEATLAANRLREAQNSTKYYEQQYQAALRLGDGEKIEAAENALNTAASNENAAAKAAQAAQDNVATAAKAKEAAATQLSSFQTKVDTINTHANTAAKGLWAAATRSVTAALNSLKAAMASNPFGVVLVAITTIIGLLSMLKTKTEESTEALDKLRDAALEDTQKLATYRAIIENVDKTSTQYKNTLRDLNAMAKEYHTSLFTENDTVEELTAKYNELTEAIRANAAEKILSESASKATKDAMEAEKNAMNELMEEAADATYHKMEEVVENVDGVWITAWRAVEKESYNIRNITSATWNQISSLVMENARKMADAFEESPEKGKAAVDNMVSQIEAILKSLGVTDKEIEEFHDDLYEYVEDSAKGFKDSYNELSRTEAQLRGIASAATTTKDVTNEAIDQMNYEQLQDQLKKVQKEIDEINNKDIDIDVKDARLLQLRNLLQEINNLIPKQLTIGSDADLERRLKQLKEDRDSYVYGSAEWKAKNSEIATLNSTLASHKSQYAENARKGSGGSGKSAAERKAQAQKEQREYLALMEQQRIERERAAKDMEFSTAQATIDALQDGTAKTLAQLKLNFEKQKEEIRRNYEDLKQQKIDAAKKAFEADPANKKKAFDPSTVNTAYTAEETANYEALLAANNKAYERALEQQHKLQEQQLRNYIREYGSIQAQKEAITKEYAQRIADEEGTIQKRALEAERDRLLSDLDFKELQNSINWEDVFSDLSRKSTTALRELRDKLRQALDAKDLTAENAQIITEKINEIGNVLTDKTDILASILPGLRERKRLTEEATNAEALYQKALEREALSINKVLADKKQILELLQGQDIRDAFGQKITVELEAISEDNKERLLASLDKDSDLYKQLLQLFENLAADTTQQGKNHEATEQSRNYAKELKDSLDSGKFKQAMSDIFNFEGMGFTEIVSLVNTNAQSLAEFTDKIGLTGTDFGDAVHGFADGVSGFNNAIQSLANGDVFGAVNGVLDGIAGFGRMGISIIAGGGNEERLENEIAELSKSQKILADAIEYFAGKIKDGSATNAESIEYYQEALKSEREWREKQQQKIDDKASESANTGYGFLGLGGKGSFNYHMAGNGWEGWTIFSNILKEHLGEMGVTHSSVNRNNIWDLSPEEMELLKNFAPKEWEKLFNGDGHRNPQELVEEYITHSGKLEEYISFLNEKLTGYTWDGFLDSYKSLLKDLDSTTEDFADHINELITNALIESFVNSAVIQDKIKELYERIAFYASEGSEGGTDLTEGEINDIRESNERIANTILEWRENMKKAGLIKGNGDATDDAKKYFENLRDMWLSTLTDMEADAVSWQKEITRIMVEDLINSLVLGDDFEEWLADWKERYADEMAHGGDIDRLNALIKEMVAKRQELAQKSQDIMDDLGYTDLMKEIEESADVFEGLHDNFLDALMDMDTDAEEWGKKIAQTLARQIIEQQLLNQAFDGILDEWKAAVADLVQNDLGHVGGDEQTLDMLKGKIAELVEKYKELAPLAQEFLQGLGLIEEEVGDTTFKDMASSWINTLMNMDATAEDWSEEIGKTMARKIIEQMVAVNLIQPLLDQLQEAFNAAMSEEGATWESVLPKLAPEIDKLKEAFGDLQPIVEQILNAFGIFKEEVEEIGDTTFKDLADSWISTLMDMDATAEDWARSVGQTMARRIIEELIVANMIQPLLDNLQTAFDNAIGEGATWQSILPVLTPYIDELKSAFGDLQPIVEQILNAFGIFREEVTEEAKEGFTDLRGAFVSSLMDMEADADKFAKDIARIMTQQMVESIIEKQFGDQLAALNEAWFNALEAGDTAAMETIRQQLIELQKLCGEAVQPLLDALAEIEYVPEVVEEEIDETITSMRDDFLSALMDMTAGTQDFVNDIKKLLTQKLVEKFVLNSAFDSWLQGMQSQYDAIFNGSMTEEQAAAAMNKLAAEWERKAKEMQEQTQAIFDLTGWSAIVEQMNSPLADLRSSFVSALMDMESDAQDFADDIAQILTEAFIDRFVLGEEFDKRLAEWQEQYAAIMKGNYSEEERALLLKNLQAAITAAKEGYAEEAQAIHDLMGTGNAKDQTASMNMADKATYDQFETYLGIAVAQQMATLQGNEVRLQILATLQAMTGITSPNGDTVKEIRTMLNTTNEYLLDIKRSNRSILSLFGEKLDTIISRLRGLI